MPGLIKDEDVEEVRSRSDIIEVISEYVSLKKAGKQFKGLCPFHKEKTPSFMVDPAKQLFHCFGCDEGGNVFTFLMKIDNINFPEAVGQLADRYGYKLQLEVSPQDIKVKSLKDKIYQLNSLAREFYHYFLTSREEGEAASDYLRQRGYTSELSNDFQLGYAPDRWDGLLKFLTKKGFSHNEIEKAGLIIKGERGTYYDRFRNRLIFPIEDIRGRVIGFGGRVLDEKNSPKYLNSPETAVFQKGKNLYALQRAKTEIVKENKVVIVEGYTDVLSLSQKGIDYAVATLGTAFTADQADLLARFTENIFMVFDSDLAGQKAAERGQELLRDNLDLLGRSKLDLEVVSLPPGNDPADFIKDHEKTDFEQVIDNSIPLIDFLLEKDMENFNLDKGEGRRKAAISALNIIAGLNSELAREEYLNKIAGKLNLPLPALLQEFNKINITKGKKDTAKSVNNLRKTDINYKTEREALSLIVQFPQEADKIYSQIELDLFSDNTHQKFISDLLKLSKEKLTSESIEKISSYQDGIYSKLISSLMYEPVYADDKRKYFEDILTKLKEFEVQRQIIQVKTKLENIDPKANQIEYDKLFQELVELESAKRGLQIN